MQGKIFENIEVFIVDTDKENVPLIVDVGHLRLKSAPFSSVYDAMTAAAMINFVISECIKEDVFADLRKGEKF